MECRSLLLLTLVLLIEISDCKSGFYYLTKEYGIRALFSKELREDLVTNWTATAFYNNSYMETGWDILEVRSNFNVSDEEQVTEAGYIEGYLTYQSIYYFWQNNMKDMFNSTEERKRVENFVNTNTEHIIKTAKEHPDDPFWYQVHLAYAQINGIFEGYKAATMANSTLSQLTKSDIMLMNVYFSLMDITGAARNLTKHDFNEALDHCSVLIKLLPGFSDVFVGHNTWTQYSTMNRIFKKYHFPIHVTNGSNELIPGMEMTFSSYPGIIESGDDFYTIRSGLITVETTNSVYDLEKYKQLKAKSTVLENFRSTVANRLAVNGSMWVHYYSIANSGTYNNQWMIVDLNKFKPGFQPQSGFLWIVEQMPGFMKSADVTSYIVGRSYWMSYNIPFFNETYVYSGYDKMLKKYGNYYSYYDNPRGLIMRRMHNSVKDLESMRRFMSYNDYKNDPYSICKTCTPKENPSYAIAARSDLIPLKKTIKPGDSRFAFFGAIDFKIVNYQMFTRDEVYARSGPTNSDGNLPNFRWSTAQVKDKHHLGQPDLWDFKPVMITFPGGLATTAGSFSIGPQPVSVIVTLLLINLFYF